MNLPYGTNIQQWIVDQMNFIEIKLWFPWCCRIIDVESALKDLPANRNAELIIKINDLHCKWNDGVYLLRSNDGKLSIYRSSSEPEVKMTIEGLTSLVYGTLSIEEIEFRGWLQTKNLLAKELLKQWFPTLPIYSAFGY